MRCPKCGGQDDKVIDSRGSREGATIRRRRECLKCGHRRARDDGVAETRRSGVCPFRQCLSALSGGDGFCAGSKKAGGKKMILLASDCLLFQMTSGESVPFSAEMISVELVGDAGSV